MELRNDTEGKAKMEKQRQQEYNNLPKKAQKKLYKEHTSDDFFDFGRIQRDNNATRRPRERASVDPERQKEYNDLLRDQVKPKAKPFREQTSDDFLKFGGHQRRVNHNGTRKPTSETL